MGSEKSMGARRSRCLLRARRGGPARRRRRRGGAGGAHARRGRRREIVLKLGERAAARPGDAGRYRAAARRERRRFAVETGIRASLDRRRHLSSWDIVRRTAKPSDGLVSRWLNRPISQRITWLAARDSGAHGRSMSRSSTPCSRASWWRSPCWPAARPGLLLGGILFHAASVLDGVDGEMARASFRTSAAGAALDSAVDMATNLLFIAAAHRASRPGATAARSAGSAAGRCSSASLGCAADRLAGPRRRRAARLRPVQALGFRSAESRTVIYWIVQTLSSRDCFAFLFMVLIIARARADGAFHLLGDRDDCGSSTFWPRSTPVPRAFRGAA